MDKFNIFHIFYEKVQTSEFVESTASTLYSRLANELLWPFGIDTIEIFNVKEAAIINSVSRKV